MTERMQTMVGNLLLLARADAGQLPVERQRVNLASLMKESWLIFEHRADVRQLQVHWDVSDPCDAITDPDKLRIVIQNLFDNAVSYAGEGGNIRVVATARNEELLVEIANTGCHVGDEDVPHLFERFWRGDQERSETQVHCGLGLSLSQRLMALLGGCITIEAQHGSEFIVRLTFPSAKTGNFGHREATPVTVAATF
jgi:signal transduction histidine kinase